MASPSVPQSNVNSEGWSEHLPHRPWTFIITSQQSSHLTAWLHLYSVEWRNQTKIHFHYEGNIVHICCSYLPVRHGGRHTDGWWHLQPKHLKWSEDQTLGCQCITSSVRDIDMGWSVTDEQPSSKSQWASPAVQHLKQLFIYWTKSFEITFDCSVHLSWIKW